MVVEIILLNDSNAAFTQATFAPVLLPPNDIGIVFSDTIFHIKDKTLEPARIFNLGERHFPVESHGKPEGTKDYLIVTYVMETLDKIYFQCVENMYGEFHVYNGLYWKENDEVIMGQGDFTDDLTNFIPFRPIVHTEKGEFVGILKVEQIQE